MITAAARWLLTVVFAAAGLGAAPRTRRTRRAGFRPYSARRFARL